MMVRKMIGRITYFEDWNHLGEHFVFEWKFQDQGDDEWMFECAAPMENDMIHYSALTKIREWGKTGIRDIIWR